MRGDAEKLDFEDDACAPVNANAKFVKKRLQSAAATTLEEIDDAVERSHRNLNRLMDEVTKYTSPQSTPDRRKSTISSAGMTNAQIAEHYSNCLKLSAENKINLKNAFDLHLIDYMSSILNHGEANFQTASSTIDASAKIYAYRVDSLYKETYKIYGGLGRSDKASPQEDGEAVDPGDEIIANKAPATPVAKKKKKKITRGSCIETNEKALNSVCNEAKLQTDELFESVRSSFEEGNTSGLFLNTLPTLSDNNRLVLHSFCEISTAVNENSVDENILEVFKCALNKIKPAFENASSCEAVSHFDFCNFEIKNLNDESFQVDSSFDVLSSCRTNGEPFVAKDIEPIDLEHANPDADTTIVAATYSENQQNFDLDPRDATILNESVDFDDEEDKPDFSEAKFAAGDSAKFKALEAALSTKDLDYSYFDPTLLQTWMGPNHWKLKRNVAKNEKDSAADLDNEEADKDKTKSKQQRGKRKQLTDSRINFNEKVDFKKILKTVSKSSTVLSATILSKYKSQDLLFEPDVDLQNPYNFNNLMLKPMIKLAKKYDDHDQSYFDAAVVDCNLESELDMQNYCPNVTTALGATGVGVDDISFADLPDDNDYSTLPTSDGGVIDDQVASTTADLNRTLDEANIVEQPYKVDKIDINYAKQAKRVDVKRLKTTMWRILNQDQIQNQSVSKLKPHATPLFPPQSFSKLCQQLSTHVSSQMMDNLSTPTIFTVLLHMCNEKTLMLEGAADFSDFNISQG